MADIGLSLLFLMVLDNPPTYVLGYIALWCGLVVSAFLSGWFFKRREALGMLRRFSGNLAALLMGLVALVLFMEGYFGFFYDQSDAFGVLKTSKRWFKRHYRVNNLGFRDNKDYVIKKEEGAGRLVFVGDSFTAGHGIIKVEDRFSNIIEKRLVNELSPDYEVYNMAVNGWDTIDEVKSLKGLVQNGFETDMVVLCFNMNDIGRTSLTTNLDTYLFYRVIDEKLSQNWLLRNSYFINFLYGRIKLPSIPELAGRAVERRVMSYDGDEWEKERELLQEFIDLCDKHGYELKVAILPLIGDLSRGFKMEAAHKKVGAFFKENGIEFIDLSDKLREYQMKKVIVNRFDSHPSEFAHRLIAHEIWEKLIKAEVQGGSD